MSNRPTQVIFVLIVFASLAIQFYGHACGLLLTPDSYQYLSAAQSFKTSFQFLSPDGSYYTYWPPLYPILLSIFDSPELVVPWIYAGCTCVIAVLIWVITSKLLKHNFSKIFVLADTILSVQYIMITIFLWSETLFLTLIIVGIYCTLKSKKSTSWFVVLLVTGFLMCLQRNAGVFIVAGISVWMLCDTERVFKQRLVRSIVLVGLSISGLCAWNIYLSNFTDSGFVVYKHEFFIHALANFSTISLTLVKIFAPFPIIITTGMGVIIVGVLVFVTIRLRNQPGIHLIHVIVLMYWLGLICMFWLDTHDMDRFLSVILPFIFIILAYWIELLSKSFTLPQKRILVFVLMLWMIYPALRTLINVRQWHHSTCL